MFPGGRAEHSRTSFLKSIQVWWCHQDLPPTFPRGADTPVATRETIRVFPPFQGYEGLGANMKLLLFAFWYLGPGSRILWA